MIVSALAAHCVKKSINGKRSNRVLDCFNTIKSIL